MPARSPKRAAGVVVVRDTREGTRFLLLRAWRNWDLPKGRLEPGESPLDAALREVREETGLADLEFAWGHEYVETEPYAGGKVVRFYVARTATERCALAVNPLLGRAEHHEYRWLTFERALQLTVPRLQRVLRWAGARIGLADAGEPREAGPAA